MRPTDSTYDRNAAAATTTLLDALKRAHTVKTCTDGSVTVDGKRIESQDWDTMAMAWDGTADGLDELGWDDAAEAMRDDDTAALDEPDCEYHTITSGAEPACGQPGTVSALWTAPADRDSASRGARVARSLMVCERCARALRGEDYEEERAAGWLAVRDEPEAVGIRCECGATRGERCEWIGRDTVIVEWMPVWLRSSHTAAATAGATRPTAPSTSGARGSAPRPWSRATRTGPAS